MALPLSWMLWLWLACMKNDVYEVLSSSTLCFSLIVYHEPIQKQWSKLTLNVFKKVTQCFGKFVHLPVDVLQWQQLLFRLSETVLAPFIISVRMLHTLCSGQKCVWSLQLFIFYTKNNVCCPQCWLCLLVLLGLNHYHKGQVCMWQWSGCYVTVGWGLQMSTCCWCSWAFHWSEGS